MPRLRLAAEPVGELAEIVGFQSIEHRTIPADERPPSRHRQLEFDDGGSVSYEAAVAEAIALTRAEREPVNTSLHRVDAARDAWTGRARPTRSYSPDWRRIDEDARSPTQAPLSCVQA